MARVSDASRTGPEGGRSAPFPLGREGAEGGLSKLIRSAGIWKRLSVPFVSSKSKSALLGPASGVSKSYASVGASRPLNEGPVRGVTGKAGGTSATRGALSPASRTLGAPWITEGELVAAALEVGMLALAVWSAGLFFVSKAVRLRLLGYWAVGFESGSGFGGAVVARVEAVFAGVSVSKATVEGLETGGLGAGFLMSRAGENTGEDAASGDTGGLPLAFKAASLGECLRFGGIGVPAF